MKKAYVIITALIVAWVPCVFWVELNSAFELPKRLSFHVLTLILAVIVLGLVAHTKALHDFKLKIPLMVFLAGMALSLPFSLTPINSYQAVFQAAAWGFWVWLTALGSDARSVKRIMPVAVGAGVLVALYALAQHGGLDFISWTPPRLVKERAIGTVGNPDFLAGYLVLILPISLYLCLSSSRRLSQVVFGLGTGIIFLAAVLTYCRGSWLALAGSLGLFVWLWLRTHSLNLRAVFPYLAGGLILLALLLGGLALARPQSLMVQRLHSFWHWQDDNITSRLYLWHAALLIIREHPLTGTGADSFSAAYQKFKYLEPMTIRSRAAIAEAPHNEYLGLGANCGIPALLAFITLIAAALSQALRPARLFRDNYISLALACSLTAYAVHLAFVYFTVEGWVLFGWLLGILGQGEQRPLEARAGGTQSEAQPETGSGVPGDSPQPRPLPVSRLYRFIAVLVFGLGIGLLLFLTAEEYRELKADYWYKQGHTWLSQRHASQAMQSLHRSLTAYPFKPDYWFDYARALQVTGMLAGNPGIIKQAENAYVNALRLNPYNGYSWDNLARFYGEVYSRYYREGRDKARDAVKKGLSRDPYNYRLWQTLGDLEAQTGSLDSARKCYRRSLELFPGNEELKSRLKVLPHYRSTPESGA